MNNLPVYRKTEQAGEIERTPTGGRFLYSPDWLAANNPGISARMPLRSEPYEAAHIPSLPAYFVNLLPEGTLLRRLAKRSKTPPDDLVTILAQLGEDAVGDVWTHSRTIPKVRLDPDIPFREAYRRLLEDSSLPPPSDAIAGVQPKMSIDRLTLPYAKGSPGAFLKLTEDDRFPFAAENEAFFMAMCGDCGIASARVELIHDSRGESALLVHRFDRRKVGRKVERLHQEDVCQLLDLYPADKYQVTVEEVGKAIEREVVAWPAAAVELIVQFAFGYLIGNNDQHAKNVSVLELRPGIWWLSPVYDMLCTLVYGDQHLALTLDGNDEELGRADFFRLARGFGVRELAVKNRLDEMLARAEPWLERLGEIGFDSLMTERLAGALKVRHASLMG